MVKIESSYILNNNKFIGISLFVIVLVTKFSVLNLPYHWDVMAYVFDYSDAIFRNNLWLFPVVEEGDPGHPPFYFALLAIAWKLLGRELYISHSVGVIFTWLSLYYTYLFGKTVLHNSGVGVLAAMLLFFNPLCFAQFGTLNLSVPLTALLIMSAFYLAQGQYLVFIACAAALALTKAEGFILVSILLFTYFLLFDTKYLKQVEIQSLVRKYLILSIPTFLYFIWFILHFKFTGILLNSDKFAHTRGMYTSLQPFLTSFSEKISQCFLNANILNSIGVGLAIFSTGWQTQAKSKTKIVFFLAVLTLFNLVFLGLIKAWVPRYAMPIYPFIDLLSAVGFLTVVNHSRKAFFPLVIYSTVALNFLVFSSAYDLHRSGYGSWEDNLEYLDMISINKEASQYVASNFQGKQVFASWPLSHTLRNPLLGYVDKSIDTVVFDYQKADIFLFTPSPWYEKSTELQSLIQQGKAISIKKFEKNNKFVELYQMQKK